MKAKCKNENDVLSTKMVDNVHKVGASLDKMN